MDAWSTAIDEEFGVGWHTDTLMGLEPTMRLMLERPDAFAPAVIEFGHRTGAASHDLAFSLRCLELLGTVAGDAFAERLDSRHVAVLVAEGWNAATIARLRPDDHDLTPMALFLHFMRLRYARADACAGRMSREAALVVVDLSDVLATRSELASLRTTTIAAARSIWSVAHPISQGANGNLVVMADRDDMLHAQVGKLRRLVLTDESLHAHKIHVWVEPLSDARFHLESHLVSLVGPVEAHPEQPPFRGSLSVSFPHDRRNDSSSSSQRR